MCCKNSYVVKKNEFNIEQYQKEIEDQKLKGKTNNTENLPQKSKRNKDFLDKHIKESTNKTFTINNEGIVAFSMQFGNRLKEFKFNAKEKHMSREQDTIKLINQLKRENAEKLIYLEEENMMLRKGMNEKV